MQDDVDRAKDGVRFAGRGNDGVADQPARDCSDIEKTDAAGHAFDNQRRRQYVDITGR